jgi:hypothetical protein
MQGSKVSEVYLYAESARSVAFHGSHQDIYDMIGMVRFYVKGYIVTATLARSMKPIVIKNESLIKTAYGIGKSYLA